MFNHPSLKVRFIVCLHIQKEAGTPPNPGHGTASLGTSTSPPPVFSQVDIIDTNKRSTYTLLYFLSVRQEGIGQIGDDDLTSDENNGWRAFISWGRRATFFDRWEKRVEDVCVNRAAYRNMEGFYMYPTCLFATRRRYKAYIDCKIRADRKKNALHSAFAFLEATRYGQL